MCETVKMPGGGVAIVCGGHHRKLPPCKFCQVNGRGFVRSTMQCDFPVGHGKTCDACICEYHATSIRKNVDYCPIHKGQHAPE